VIEREHNINSTQSKPSIRARGLLAGAIFLLLVVLELPFGGALYHPSSGIVASILVLTLLVNPIGRLLFKRTFFDKRDLVVVYTVVGVGAIFLGTTVLGQFIHTLPGLVNLALSDPRTYQPLVDSLSDWIIIKDIDAVLGYYVGGASVPWEHWIKPMISWTVFFAIICLALYFLAIIFRKRWTDQEHLVYPAIAPTLRVIDEGLEFKKGSIWFDKLMWAGFAIGGFYALIMVLGQFTPYVTATRYGLTDKWNLLVGATDNSSPFFLYRVQVDPYLIGMATFVRQDVLFSVWFFTIVKWFLQLLCTRLDWDVVYGLPNPNILGLGGWFGMGLIMMWLIRKQVWEALTYALRKDKSTRDRDTESIRMAFWAFIACYVLLVVFARVFLHIACTWGFLLFGLFFVGLIGSARARSEGGVGWQGLGVSLDYELIIPIAGATRLGFDNIAGMGFTYLLPVTCVGGIMPITLETLKMSDKMSVSRKVVGWSIAVGYLVGMALVFSVGLPRIYRVGANLLPSTQTSGWPLRIFRLFLPGIPYGYPGSSIVPALVCVAGALATTGLWKLSTIFVSWPLHPLGFVVAMPHFHWVFVTNFFIAWLIRFPITRYGGRRAMLKAMPFFIGLFLGDVAINTLGTVIGKIIA
jgi:hypothetical protein